MKAVKYPEYGEGVVTHNYDDGRAVVWFASQGYEMSSGQGLVIEWELLTPVVAESEATP